METQSLLDAIFSLFWDKLSNADDIDIHCIRVFDSGGRGEGLAQMLNGGLVSF